MTYGPYKIQFELSSKRCYSLEVDQEVHDYQWGHKHYSHSDATEKRQAVLNVKSQIKVQRQTEPSVIKSHPPAAVLFSFVFCD